MNCLLRLPPALDQRRALEALAAARAWDGCELDAAVLAADPDLEEFLDSCDLAVLFLGELLPADLSRYLAEAGPELRNRLLTHAEGLLERAVGLGVGQCSVDLGCDRGTGEGELWTGRLQLLSDLLANAAEQGCDLCLPLRLPAVDARLELRTRALLEELGHPRCRLLLDIVPEELPRDFDLAEHLRPWHRLLGALRLRYEPDLGLQLPRERQEAVAAALREIGYSGPVVFAPETARPSVYQRELAALSADLEEVWRT